jgi:transcriptional regulator with GAF, ATPase, and Fis domain
VVNVVSIDRSSLWEFSADLRQARWTHQSTDPEFPPLPREFSAEQFPWTFETTKRGHPMRFARSDELGSEAAIDRQSFGRLGEKSVLVIPYSIGGVLVCGLSFAALRHEREWPDHLIAKMQLVGEIIAGALHRARMEEKYEDALQQMRRLSDQLHGETIQLAAASEIQRTLQEVIGESDAIKHVFFRVEQVAPTDAAVLVLGETGTGKGTSSIRSRKGGTVIGNTFRR